MSGVIAALSPSTSTFCVELAKAAKKHGTVIRDGPELPALLLEGPRRRSSRRRSTRIAEVCDILYGNEGGLSSSASASRARRPVASPSTRRSRTSRPLIGRVKEAYPEAKYIGTSLREVVSANHHKWAWSCGTRASSWSARCGDIDVIDRIGGGDGSGGRRALRHPQGLGREAVRPVRLGDRRPGRHRRCSTNGAPADEEHGLGDLEGQRAREAVGSRVPGW